jgi:hypothetical protein
VNHGKKRKKPGFSIWNARLEESSLLLPLKR